MDREIRRIQHSKESGIRTIEKSISSRNVLEGEHIISKQKGKPLASFKKHKGVLWKNNFSKDGNQIVDRDLKVERNIISNGNLQLNNIPIFEAYSTGQTNLAIANTIPQIEFDNENIDNTNSFASHNFTAPVDGYY